VTTSRKIHLVQQLIDISVLLVAPFQSSDTLCTSHSGTNTISTTSNSPLLRVVNHVATELRNNPRLSQDSVRAQDVWARLPAVVSRLCESGMSVLGSQHDAEGKSGK